MHSKKILALTFYEDFSRLFFALQFHNKNNFKIDLFATHLSGYIYTENKIKLNKIFLPHAIRAFDRQDSPEIDQEKLIWIAEYSIKFGLGKCQAVNLAHKYFQFFYDRLATQEYHCCIISGDSRMQSRALSIACDLLKVPKLFFEQAPFGSTLLDKEGVNCNASVRSRPELIERSDEVTVDFHKKKAWKSKFRLRIVDYLFSSITLGLLYPEIVEEKRISDLIKRYLYPLKFQKLGIRPPREENILVIGQVPTDANMLMHSKLTNHTQLIQDIMSTQSNIVFREHPLYKGCYEKTLYETINNNDILKLSVNESLERDIKESNKIIVINSTVGMEAILQHRRNVLVYGDSIYDYLFGVFKPENISEFLSAPSHYNKELLFHNLAWFNKNFIRGHFRDEDLTKLADDIGIKINAI